MHVETFYYYDKEANLAIKWCCCRWFGNVLDESVVFHEAKKPIMARKSMYSKANTDYWVAWRKFTIKDRHAIQILMYRDLD